MAVFNLNWQISKILSIHILPRLTWCFESVKIISLLQESGKGWPKLLRISASQIGTATRANIHPARRYIAWRGIIIGLLELQVDGLRQIWENHEEDRWSEIEFWCLYPLWMDPIGKVLRSSGGNHDRRAVHISIWLSSALTCFADIDNYGIATPHWDSKIPERIRSWYVWTVVQG